MPIISKSSNLALLVAASIMLWVLHQNYPDPHLLNLFFTFATLAVNYIVFKIGLEHMVERRVSDPMMRYTSRKTISIVQWVVFLFIFARIWIQNPQALLVAYGLIGAGVAVSLQDFFKNFAGGLTLFFSRPYKVGDRIEIDGKAGDVIDIGVMYTTVMEIGEWIKGDLATGRISMVPNGLILTRPLNNYTKDHGFLWDEIHIPLTYDSDVEYARDKILAMVRKEIKKIQSDASREITRIQKKYYFSKRSLEPEIFVNITDNYIDLAVRFISTVRERRALNSRLSAAIVDWISRSKRVRLGSATLSIVSLPKEISR